MKVFILLAMIVAVVVCEHCRQPGPGPECEQHHVTQCSGGVHVVCGPNNDCVCVTNDHHGTCTAASDCDSGCSPRKGHCVDSQCRCRLN